MLSLSAVSDAILPVSLQKYYFINFNDFVAFWTDSIFGDGSDL